MPMIWLMRKMADSVTAADLPAGMDLYAAYADGKYRNVDQVRARFPDKRVVTITVRGGDQDADVCDCETGDLTPQQAFTWVVNQRAKGHWPTVYVVAYQWPELRRQFQSQKVAEPPYWVAKYDNNPTLMPDAVAKQYGGDLPGHYDMSVVADYWPGVDAAPVHQGEEVIEYRIVTVPAPDSSGRQLQAHDVDGKGLGPFNNDVLVTIKANDDGRPFKGSVEPFGYLGQTVLSFWREDGQPVAQGNVGVVLSHPQR